MAGDKIADELPHKAKTYAFLDESPLKTLVSQNESLSTADNSTTSVNNRLLPEMSITKSKGLLEKPQKSPMSFTKE